MNKLDREQLKQKAQHVTAVRAAEERLEKAIAEYNGVVEEAKQKVLEAQESLNEAISSADEWRDGINADQEAYFEEKSEKWQNGQAGEKYGDWKDSFQSPYEVVEVEFPEPVEAPELEVANTIEQLLEEPE